MTEWDIVDTLVNGQARSREMLESLFGLPLGEQEGNEDYRFFVARRNLLSEGSMLSRLELRVHRGSNQAALVVARLDKSHITSGQARERYPELKICSVPRGHSPQELVSFSIDKPAGRLSLGFATGRPDALAEIVYEPHAAAG
jgi:hypothetical protein